MSTETDKTEQPKVLVVKDDETLLDILKRVLEVSGFPAATAANVGDALHVINSEPINVLLCVLHLPAASDCITVLKGMRAMNPVAVVIVLTGPPELDQTVLGQLQADGILVKPMPVQELVARIRNEWSKRWAA